MYDSPVWLFALYLSCSFSAVSAKSSSTNDSPGRRPDYIAAGKETREIPGQVPMVIEDPSATPVSGR